MTDGRVEKPSGGFLLLALGGRRVELGLQRRAGLEAGAGRSRDVDLGAGGGVAALAGGALLDREGAKADEAHFVAFLERLGDPVEDCKVAVSNRRRAAWARFGSEWPEMQGIRRALP